MDKLFAGFLASILFLMIIGPILVIWSLNTLFPQLNIPFNPETWCAAIVLAGVFNRNIPEKK